MGLLDLPRVGRNYASTVHVAAHGGGGDNYDTLCCCAGCLPCIVYPQLDLPVSFLHSLLPPPASSPVILATSCTYQVLFNLRLLLAM